MLFSVGGFEVLPLVYGSVDTSVSPYNAPTGLLPPPSREYCFHLCLCFCLCVWLLSGLLNKKLSYCWQSARRV